MNLKPKKTSPTVVKKNDLIESSFSLSVLEQRMILSAVSKIDSKSTLEEDRDIYIKPYDIYDLLNNNVYHEMKQTCDKLLRKIIIIKNENGDELKFQWLSEVEYLNTQARIRLRFHERIIPYISEITGRFTQYKYEFVKNFTSTYSLRFYEFFLQWKQTGVYKISLEELRYRLRLEKKYPNVSDLQKKTIRVAIREINELSDLHVTYSTIKVGRTVTGFQFLYKFKTKEEIKAIREKSNKRLAVDRAKHIKNAEKMKKKEKEPVVDKEKHIKNIEKMKDILKGKTTDKS